MCCDHSVWRWTVDVPPTCQKDFESNAEWQRSRFPARWSRRRDRARGVRQTLHCGAHVRFLPPFFYGSCVLYVSNSPCAGPRNRPKSGCCGPAEATYKLFSRQWRKKKVTSGSFPLSCGLSWHNATIFLIKLSSWRIYLFVRRPVTSFLVSF